MVQTTTIPELQVPDEEDEDLAVDEVPGDSPDIPTAMRVPVPPKKSASAGVKATARAAAYLHPPAPCCRCQRAHLVSTGDEARQEGQVLPLSRVPARADPRPGWSGP